MRRTTIAMTVALILLAGGVGVAGPASPDSPQIEAIRTKLLRLPYYGVFDFLAFSYKDGVVRLSGYVYHAPLKVDAERAVRQVPEVREVANAIEILPASTFDDNLRWGVYYAIYADPFLSRYAPGGGIPWGRMHRTPGWPYGFDRRFPGLEPVGSYPISIIVKNGHVTLMGVVDNESDRMLAEMRAREVWGSMKVDNELQIVKATT